MDLKQILNTVFKPRRKNSSEQYSPIFSNRPGVVQWYMKATCWNQARRLKTYDALAAKLRSQMALGAIIKSRAELYAELGNNGKKKGDGRNLQAQCWAEMALRRAQGYPPSALFKGLIPENELSLISVADVISANEVIAAAFENAAEITRVKSKVSKAMRGAFLSGLKYTVIGLALPYMLGIGWLGGFLQGFAPVSEWPRKLQQAYFYYNSPEALIQLGIGVGAFTVLLTAVLVSLPRWNGPQRGKVDGKWPVYSLYALLSGAVLLKTIASMTAIGKNIVGSLREIRETSTPHIAYYIDTMVFRLEKEGGKMDKAFDVPVFDAETRVDLVSYLEAGDFGDAIQKVSKELTDSLDEKIKKRTTMVTFISFIPVIIGASASYDILMGSFSVFNNLF